MCVKVCVWVGVRGRCVGRCVRVKPVAHVATFPRDSEQFSHFSG